MGEAVTRDRTGINATTRDGAAPIAAPGSLIFNFLGSPVNLSTDQPLRKPLAAQISSTDPA